MIIILEIADRDLLCWDLDQDVLCVLFAKGTPWIPTCAPSLLTKSTEERTHYLREGDKKFMKKKQ